jgi:hypothetical protein
VRANIATLPQDSLSQLRQIPAWVWFGGWVYVVLMINASVLLSDSDTYWQTATGQWIIDHGALPRSDSYSFTKSGDYWISSSWLAQVAFAAAYRVFGWAGPLSLAAAAAASTFACLTFILCRRMPAAYAILIAFVALLVSVTHLFARPHVLALPVMFAWANGLLSASERREAPSFWLLPLLALWANLHGGFVFGLVLVGGFGLDALWNASAENRKPLALRWLAFGACACAACCVTPYGWETVVASYRILDLGELLHIIMEWMPADFSTLSRFEICILVLIGGALLGGVKLSPPRIALVLGLLHMGLSHVRNQEVFVLLLPLVLLKPVGDQFGLRASNAEDRSGVSLASVVALIAVFGIGTLTSAARGTLRPPAINSPVAAVDALKASHAKRVLNDAFFGGYLIWREVPVFIDGRAELYGEEFVMKYFNALFLKDVNVLYDLLKVYDIDALLLKRDTPASLLLDHLDGWRRIYADETAVLHVRAGN